MFRDVDKRLRKDNPVAVAGLLIRLVQTLCKLPALVFDLFWCSVAAPVC